MKTQHDGGAHAALSGPAMNISLGAGMCLVIAGTFTAIWSLMIFAAWLSSPAHLDETLGNQWITQSLLMVFIVLLMQSGVAEAQQVLRARVAPQSALRARVRALRRLNWQAWGLCSLPLLLDGLRHLTQSASPSLAQALVRLSAGPAWLGLLMLAAAWFSAAWQGRLSASASVLVALACAALAAQPAWLIGALGGRDGAGLALAGQALLLLALIWGLAPAMERPQAREGAWPWLREQGVRFAKGFDLLDKSANPAGNIAGAQLVWLNIISQNSMFKHVGDAHPSVGGYLLRLFVLSLIALTSLQCRQLHWRHLLAPRGPQRGAVGLYVLRDTLRAFVRVLPLAALVLVPLYLLQLSLSHPLQWLLEGGRVAHILLTLSLDMLLCTLLMTLLRGLLRSQPAVIGLLVALLALGLLAWALLPPGTWTSMPVPRDGLGLGVELVLVLALLPALRPAWSGVDLAALMRRNAAALEKRRQRQA